MRQVKIDENIYLLLEDHFTNDRELSAEEILKIKQFFFKKWKARDSRTNRVNDYYAEQRIRGILEL